MVESVDVFRSWGLNIVESVYTHVNPFTGRKYDNIPHRIVEIPSVYTQPDGPLPAVAKIDPEFIRTHHGPKERVKPYSVLLSDGFQTTYLQILKVNANQNPGHAYYGWCCIGGKVSTSTNFTTGKETAISWFERKFLELTGNDWSGRRRFVNLPDKLHLANQETIEHQLPPQDNARDLSPKRR